MLQYREQVECFLAGPVREGRYLLENDPDYRGFYMIRNVPVFSTNRRGGNAPGETFDEAYLDRILDHHCNVLEETGHLVPIFEEHHPDDKFQDSRPKIGHMQNLVKGRERVACPDTHQLVELPTIYCDFRRIKPEYAARFLAGDLEHRSIEIVPGNPRISGCSCSSTVPPYFKYRNLIVELAEGVEAPVVKSLRLREPPRADGQPSRMAICFSEIASFAAAQGVTIPPKPAAPASPYRASTGVARFKWPEEGATVTTSTSTKRFAAADGFWIYRDGQPMGGPFASDLDALAFLHRQVGYSASHAIQYEGWQVMRIADGVSANVSPGFILNAERGARTQKFIGRGYSLAELEAMPTISQGHMDNLKVDTGTMRVWLSRMTREDGMPYNNAVTVERLINGVWTEVEQYEAFKAARAGSAAEPRKFMDSWAADQLVLMVDNDYGLYQRKIAAVAAMQDEARAGHPPRLAVVAEALRPVAAAAIPSLVGGAIAGPAEINAAALELAEGVLAEWSLGNFYRAGQMPARFTGGNTVSKAPKLNAVRFAEGAEVEVVDQATGEVIWSGAFADLLAENTGDAEVEGAINAIRGGTSAEVTVGGGANPLRIIRKPPGEGVRLREVPPVERVRYQAAGAQRTASPVKFAEHVAVISKVPTAFQGTTPEAVAGAWVAQNFSAPEVKAWLDAKVVLPLAAKAMRTAGITAAYAARPDRKFKGLTFGQAVEAKKRPVRMEEAAPAEVDPKLVKKAEDAQAEADKAQEEADKLAAEVEAAGGTAPEPAAGEEAAADAGAAAGDEDMMEEEEADPAAMTPEQKAAKIEELKAELAKLEGTSTPPDAGNKDQPTKASENALRIKLSQVESSLAARDQKDRLDGVVKHLRDKRKSFNEDSVRAIFTTAGVLDDQKKTDAFLKHYAAGLASPPSSRLTEEETSADNGMLAKYAQNPVHLDKAQVLLDSYFADAGAQKMQPNPEVFLEQSMKNFFKELRGAKGATNGTRARITAR